MMVNDINDFVNNGIIPPNSLISVRANYDKTSLNLSSVSMPKTKCAYKDNLIAKELEPAFRAIAFYENNRWATGYRIGWGRTDVYLANRIKSYILDFINQHSDSKNPSLTKLHKYFRRQCVDHKSMEPTYELWKYLKTEKTHTEQIIKNGMGVLQIIMQRCSED